MTTTLTLLDGKGTLGPILDSGWVVVEDTTHVSTADSDGGVGSLSNLSTAYGVNSEFVIDNQASFTHSAMGTITGRVTDVNISGATDVTSAEVSLTISTVLSILNVDATAAPLGEGILLTSWGGL